MRQFFFIACVSLLALVFSSCGSDNSNGGNWQSSQTSAVLNAVGGGVSQVNTTQSTQNLNPQSAHVAHLMARMSNDETTSPALNATVNCVGGGTITLSGSLTQTATGSSPDTTTRFDYNYSFVFNNCVSQSDDGKSYTLSGSEITVSGSSTLVTTGADPDLSFTSTDQISLAGNVEVGGSESLSCDIAISESLATQNSNGVFTDNGTYNGTVCGQPENGSISIAVSS